MFASGAEEKVIRIFTAPLTFKNYLKHITNDVEDFESTTLADGASIPALGLTNKALLDIENPNKEETIVVGSYSRDLNYDEPPLEEELVRKTLWPELQKLYGHGYEIFAMAARRDGSLLATACKATSAEHAAIILWDTNSWSQTQKLVLHQLTVTQLSFSPDDKHLLSVSRDRRWSLFTRIEGKYELKAASIKKDGLHSRIIWCCAWSSDSLHFATGSRDGKIGVWSENVGKNGQQLLPVASLLIKDVSVTALAFMPNKRIGFPYVLAIGLESGCIDIKQICGSFEWMNLVALDTSIAHHATVRRLEFRPRKNDGKRTSQLASCGADGAIKVYSVDLS